MFIDRNTINSSAAHDRNSGDLSTQEIPSPDSETIVMSEEEYDYDYDSSVYDGFDYTAIIDEVDQLHFDRPVSRASEVSQQSTQDVNAPSSDDEFVDHTSSAYSRFNTNSTAHSAPTSEPYLSEYEDSDVESTSEVKWDWGNRPRFASNSTPENRTSPQYGSGSDSSDYDSDSESDGEKWLPPPPRWNNTSPPSAYKLRDAFILYEQRWTTLFSREGLTFHSVPWPQYPPPAAVLDINIRSIREFLRVPALAGTSICVLKTTVRQALLRFHPDKAGLLLTRVEESQRKAVMEGCTAVTRCLNEIKESL